MANNEMSGSEMRQRLSWGAGIAIGMGSGVALGTSMDNMGAGIGIGVVIGVVVAIAIGSVGRRRAQAPGDDTDELPDEDAPGSGL